MSARAVTMERELVTPEGVALPFELAGAGERLVAFALDSLLILLLLVLALVLCLALPEDWRFAFLVLAWFGLTQFYFTITELHGQGASPGKRRCELRVIDRHGGRLTATAIFTRNVTRMVEVQLPLVLLLDPVGTEDQPPWMKLVLFGWILVLGVFPLLNRDRLRLGDLVGGTLVVHSPKAVLLPDLSVVAQRQLLREDRPAAAEYVFTPEQLEIYGVYELQVLEEVLRSNRPDLEHACRIIADRVIAKIGYVRPPAFQPARFLAAFYAAQRARLEQGLLLGKRKARKSR